MIMVYSVCHYVCIFWIITAFSGARSFGNFTVPGSNVVSSAVVVVSGPFVVVVVVSASVTVVVI